MRPIDADALMETIRAQGYPLRSYFNSTDRGMFTVGIQQAVDEQPTVAASPWHRVEEPPKQNGAFAVACVYDGKLYWYKGIYIDGKWLREGDGIEMPADYWMPVPEPPKEEDA